MKFVIYNLLLIISVFANAKTNDVTKEDNMMQENFVRELDFINLNNIEKTTPEERSYSKKEVEGYIDDDKDGADDRLERFVQKISYKGNKIPLYYKIMRAKYFLLRKCKNFSIESFTCKKAYVTYMRINSVIDCMEPKKKYSIEELKDIIKENTKVNEKALSISHKWIDDKIYKIMDNSEWEKMDKNKQFYTYPKRNCR